MFQERLVTEILISRDWRSSLIQEKKKNRVAETQRDVHHKLLL